MRTRIVILGVAIALGLFAAFAAGRYLDSARKSIVADSQPAEVLVVAKDIPPGTTAEKALEDKAIVKREVARQYVAEQALSSYATIDGQVCSAGLTRGEQVTRGDFRYASEAGAAYSVPEGHLAVAVRYDPVRGVSGLVKPGDWVSVMSTFEEKPGDITTALSRIVVSRARVLAVGQNLSTFEATTTVNTVSNTTQGSGSLMGSGGTGQTADNMVTVTLAVRPVDAERLLFADDEGKLRLALIGKTDPLDPDTRGVRWPDIKK